MEKTKTKYFSARNITYFAVLLALVVVLQVCGGYFKIGQTSLSFVLVPIVLGGILLGVGAGAFLGFTFGLIVLIYGITGADAFTFMLFNAKPFMTILICIGKGVAAGVVPALLYGLIAKKSRYAAVFVAAATAPIVNTGLFIVGALCMHNTFGELFGVYGKEIFTFLFIGCAGINFIIEFAINLVFAPSLYTVTNVVEKRIMRRHDTPKTESVKKEEEKTDL